MENPKYAMCSGGVNSATEISVGEKDCYCLLWDPEPPLKYEIRELETAIGTVDLEYVIPIKDKQKVLRTLWPFKGPVPKLNDTFFDIHSQKEFKVKEFRVIRCRGRNMICAPGYPNTGGMVVDWATDQRNASQQWDAKKGA